jgi:hypothetical protein
MDNHKVSEFAAHYQSLSEWELADIHGKYTSLTEEARAALDAVVADRRIDFEKMRQAEAVEELERAAIEQTKSEKKTKRDSRLFKIFLAVGLPIIILGALLRPERAYETLISARAGCGFGCSGVDRSCN